MAPPIRLRELIRAGARALSRYTGTLVAVFLAQALVAASCIAAVAVVLAQTFAHLPMFDQAVDGDLVALIWSLRHGRSSLVAIGGVVFGALVVWQLVTWFLAGGLYGVLVERPESRSETARCFGASGAATYLPYARLAVLALPGGALVMTVFGVSLELVAPQLETALTIPQLIAPLALALVPSALLLHVLWTITDYARVELTLRHDTHAPSVLATYLRAAGYVVRRPVTLVHAGAGWLGFGIVTATYALLAHDRPMYGAGGAIILLVARQGVALLRMAIRVAIMAGQVELGRTRTPPPRPAPKPAPAAA